MKSIQRKDFVIAGVVEKAHGTKGELKFQLEQKIKLKEWVFLEIQEKPVPFFIESISENLYQPIIKLGDIDTVNEAENYTGLNVLVPMKQTKSRTRAVDLDIIGFELIDSKLGYIGKVDSIEEMPHQLMIKTIVNENEVLIPAVEEFITDIDEQTKTVHLKLPEGIIDL